MKGNHYCFEKNVSDRKGSIFGYGATPFSRVEVRITGQGALSSLKKTRFLVRRRVPFFGSKIENSEKQLSAQQWDTYSSPSAELFAANAQIRKDDQTVV